MNDNYYEELGVEPGASRDQLREAHRQRVSDLEAAREKKNVSDSQLQANRDEVARVRAAWNVLSDPFQRQRYDARLSSPSESSGEGGEVELVDDDTAAQQSSGAEVTGWRKLLAPPPPKNAGGGNGNRNGTRSPNGKNPATGRRQRPEPTVVLPDGMSIAEPRVRGMALLFDISVLIVIFFAVSLAVPRLVQSDYQDIQDRISKVGSLKDARSSLTDAQKSAATAKTASDKKSAQSDLKSAQKDYKSAQKDAKGAGVPEARLDDSTKKLQTYSDHLSDKVRTTSLVTQATTFVLALLYLVPITVRKGYTMGMRGRRIRVVRVDGSPVGWYPTFTRFALPILLALAIPSFGVVLGLGMVAWAYFDRNGQGLHDKLARTLVVDA
jgi:curved DNA-binding protein CbpA